MAAVYYIGVFCTWAYNYIMIYVSQGMLKKVRDDLFRHMEHLPSAILTQNPMETS